MRCLNCEQEMVNCEVQTQKDRISYDTCESCGSLWLDRGELDKMAFQVRGSIEYCSQDSAGDIPESLRQCPRCEQITLSKVKFIGYEDFILDRCRNCEGFWLDGKELNLLNERLYRIMPVEGKGFSDFFNNVHVPYWFRRVKRKSSETDYKIDVPPVKGAVLKGETMHSCPNCRHPLSTYQIFRIEIDGCPKCKGMFFDADELRKLKDKKEKGNWQDLRWLDDEMEAIDNVKVMRSERRCPKCPETHLLTTTFGTLNILIDWCPRCRGTWLDKGEFDDIVGRLRDQLNKLSSEDMRKKLYSEIKEIWDGPENVLSEVLDAKAAISAFLTILVYEHPKVAKFLLRIPRLAI